MLSDSERDLLSQLRDSSEGQVDDDWRDVYLDNVKLRASNPRRFAALTGSLAKKGLYRIEDDAWAMVRMTDSVDGE